ncbi:MAG TPA: acyl carrier protein [Bacillota bacterium]|nr:acyl carrier protein [Bacillota bacterium]
MVLEKIEALISEQFGVDKSEISLNTSFVEDLNADSLDVVEFIMALEEEFDIQINDEDVENIKTVGDVVNYINEKL